MDTYEEILGPISTHVVTNHRASGKGNRIEFLIISLRNLLGMGYSIAAVRECVCVFMYVGPF